MNVKIKIFYVIIAALMLSCSSHTKSKLTDVNSKNKVALISTKFGDIEILLYKETPLHKENFEKLVENGFYDSLLFHRVIKNFMIQGGDPTSKNAKPNAVLGNGGPNYTITAEFNNLLIHKKGALAAAREGDNINPEKRSSGSQFYIVQGQVLNDEQINQMEQRITKQLRSDFIRIFLMKPENLSVKTKYDEFQKTKNTKATAELIKQIEKEHKIELDSFASFKYTIEQRNIYKTLGGTPHLDGSYTVFGEVIKGFNVIDSIANTKTGKSDRPINDVVFSIKIKIID